MKYALFAGEIFYPCGGWDDLKAQNDSYDELRKVWDANQSKDARMKGVFKWDWGHIVDLETGEQTILAPGGW